MWKFCYKNYPKARPNNLTIQLAIILFHLFIFKQFPARHHCAAKTLFYVHEKPYNPTYSSIYSGCIFLSIILSNLFLKLCYVLTFCVHCARFCPAAAILSWYTPCHCHVNIYYRCYINKHKTSAFILSCIPRDGLVPYRIMGGRRYVVSLPWTQFILALMYSWSEMWSHAKIYNH